MLDKKQIQAIFLFEFKVGCKAAETTRNINNAFGPGTANEHTVQWWFKKFCEGDEECSDWPLEVDNNQLRGSSKLILFQLHKKLLKESTSTILWSFGIWSKLKRWKSLISGCLMSWPQTKKLLFWSIFSYSRHQQWTVSLSDCEVWWKVDFIHQLISTSSIARLRRSSKALLKAILALIKGLSWSLFGGLLPVWSTTAFWISAKPLHLWCMLSKLMRCTRNCNSVASTGQQKGLNSPWQWLTTCHTTDVLKVELIWLSSFASSAIFTWPLANWLPLLQASQQPFAGKMLPQAAGGGKGFPRICQFPKHRFLCYRNKQTYFLLEKMFWLKWLLFLLIKMCLSLIIMV